ncbi:MAG: hypothetical protein SR2Q5_07605 [Quinella sp. 2Q5]|nr:hypothetical protein [Quinella sp. 2Q5]
MKSSDEKQILANAEIIEVLHWFNGETDRISKELDEMYGSKRTIDGKHEAFAEAHKEFARRMNSIGEKYNLLKT